MSKLRDEFNAMAGMIGGFGQLGQSETEEPQNMYSPFTSNLLMQAVSGTPGTGAAPLDGPGQQGGGRAPVSSRRSDLLAMIKAPQSINEMPSSVSSQMAARAREQMQQGQLQMQGQMQQGQQGQYAQQMQQPMQGQYAQQMQPMQQPMQQMQQPMQQMQQAQPGRAAVAPRQQPMQSAIPMAQATLPPAPAPQVARAPAQPDILSEVIKMVDALRQETVALKAEVADLRQRKPSEEMAAAISVEMANACCVCRAVVAANTVEYSIAVDDQPSTRGGPADDELLATALEGAASVSVAAGEEVVLTYPMYRRSVDADAPDMGQEIYMRRRTIHPQTAQVYHSYVKVVGTYSGETVQYVSGFDLP
jgi:hypothetical protein